MALSKVTGVAKAIIRGLEKRPWIPMAIYLGVFALFVLASGLMIVDQHCGSRFNILDGSMIDGPSQYPLKMYHTSYDGRRLRVYS